MKKISKFILGLFLVSAIAFNFSFADNSLNSQDSNSLETSDTSQISEDANKTTNSNSSVPIDVGGTDINTEKIEQELGNLADKGENLAYKIVEQISDKCLPFCTILILWGSVLYFILGIRNLYKKRQGLLLMWGAFTFCVIAKVINFAFWFAFVR